MDSRGLVFTAKQPPKRAALVAAYEDLARRGFSDLDRFPPGDLAFRQRLHDKRLAFYREERRMHFGAMALVGLALVVLLPAVLRADEFFLPLAALEGLLLVLFAPYVFVYRRYEETLRRMNDASMLLENEIRLREEQPPSE